MTRLNLFLATLHSFPKSTVKAWKSLPICTAVIRTYLFTLYLFFDLVRVLFVDSF